MELTPEIPRLVADLEAAWAAPGLGERVRIEVSKRMRRSLGIYSSRGKVIRISATLLEGGARELLPEVVCHELAHALSFERHGRVRPHGAEWRALMVEAGFAPRVRIASDLLPAYTPKRRPASWLHECPVCKASRRARRPVPQWSCAPCRAAGRSGRVRIQRVGK